MRPFLLALLDYDRWATEQWLAALPSLAFSAEAEPVLVHMVHAQQTWSRRLRGEELQPEADQAGGLSAAFARAHEKLVGQAQSEDLDRVFHWTRKRTGTHHRHTVGTALFHVVNHGTYHRGHLRGLAGQDGAFPDTDATRWEEPAITPPPPGFWRVLAHYHAWATRQWRDSGFPDGESLTRVQRHDYGCFAGWLDGVAREHNWTEGLPDNAAPDWEEQCGRVWADLMAAVGPDATSTWKRPVKGDVTRPLWVIAFHVFNHATYHRGHLRGLAQRMGFEGFPDTDFVLWPGSEGVALLSG